MGSPSKERKSQKETTKRNQHKKNRCIKIDRLSTLHRNVKNIVSLSSVGNSLATKQKFIAVSFFTPGVVGRTNPFSFFLSNFVFIFFSNLFFFLLAHLVAHTFSRH